MKLTITSTWPPDGWTYRDTKTGYAEPAPKVNSYSQVVDGIWRMRQNNKAIYKSAQERSRDAAEQALVDFTTWRLARKGAFELIVLEPGDEEKLTAAGIRIKKKHGRSALDIPLKPVEQAGAKPAVLVSIKQAVGIMRDWLGEGGEPVAQEQAEARASVCSSCPMNDASSTWWSWFTGAAAGAVKAQLEHKHHLNLKTASDENIGVCAACGCQLHLKVWTPLEHIKAHMDYESWTRLDKNCWILHEA